MTTPNMTDEVAKDFVDSIFHAIKASQTIDQLEMIIEESPVLMKNSMHEGKYPKIKFKLTPNEIRTLQNAGYIDKEYELTNDISSRLDDPLTKLLYSLVWKNGDLKKVKHIVKGVMNDKDDHSEIEAGLVFYQFGRYLTKTTGEPIIDQHVMRAFAVHMCCDHDKISQIRKLGLLKKSHNEIIRQYKSWLMSHSFNLNFQMPEDYFFHVDRILFAVGKSIKDG